MPLNHQRRFWRDAADPGELRDIELHIGLLEQLRQQHTALDQAQDRAVLRFCLVDAVAHRDASAARRILNDDGWVARYELAKMAGDQSSNGVVAAARR